MDAENINDTNAEPSEEEVIPSVPLFNRAPSYLVSAGNHNLAANGDTSLFETGIDVAKGVAGAWAGAEVGALAGPMGAIAGGLIGGVTGFMGTDFTVASAMSGAASLTNSAIAIGNMLPGEEQAQVDVHDWMAGYDDNLPAYYDDHKAAVDITGEIAGSMIPGTLAIRGYNMGAKALLAGRAGFIGANMEAGTGLLGGTSKVLLKMANEEALKSAGTYSYLNKTFITGLAAGAGEQVIQNAVFGTAAAVTMFKSPLLEDQDVSDIASNVLWTSLLGGGIGGALEGAVAKNFISKSLDKKASDLMHLTHVNEVQGVDAWQRIGGYMNSYDTIKSATPENLNALAETYGNVPSKLRTDNLSRIEDLVRGEIKGLAENDAGISNMFSDALMQGDNFENVMKHAFGLKGISRLNTAHKEEAIINNLKLKINAGKQISADEYKLLDANKTVYTKLWGEGRGQLNTEAFNTVDLASTLKKGEKINITDTGVTAGNKSFSFKSGKSHDIRTMDVHEAEAYHLYLNAKPALAADASIEYFDIHRLGKAVKDLRAAGTDANEILSYKVKDAQGNLITGLTRAKLEHLHEEAVGAITKDLQSASIAGGKLTTQDSEFARLLNMTKGTTLKSKDELNDRAKSIAKILTNDDIALMTNQRVGKIDGTTVSTYERDLFAKESHVEDFLASAKKGGKQAVPAKDLILQPQIAKMTMDAKVLQDSDQFLTEGMTYITQREKLWKQEADNVFTTITPSWVAEQMPETGTEAIRQVTAKGIGMKMFSFADGAYGTVESTAQSVGKLVNRWRTEQAKLMDDVFAPHFNKLITGGIDHWMEVSKVEKLIRSSPELYVFDSAGKHLVLKKTKDYFDAVAKGMKVTTPDIGNAVETIEINSPIVRSFLKQHIAINGAREGKFSQIANTLHGKTSARDPNVLYWPPKDPSNYPFIAFVTDPKVSGTGHMSMIHASSAEKLQALIDKVPTHLSIEKAPVVRTKPETERWHKVIGDFKREETLGDNYVDSLVKKAGVASEYTPSTDPAKMLGDLLKWHQDKEGQLIRETVGLKHAKFFSELKRMDEQFTDVANSRTGWASLSKFAAERVGSPYMSYIRTCLDIPNLEHVPARAIQGWLDNQVSKVWNDLANATSKTASIEGLDKINAAMDKFGIKPFDYDVATQALANHVADKGALGTFTRRSQGLIASITLGLDSLTGVVNTVGSAVLMVPELQSVIKLLENDPEAMGALGSALKSKIPGTEHEVMLPGKILAKAMTKAMTAEGRAFTASIGQSTKHLEEVALAYDHFALPEIYTTADLNSKLTAGYNATMKLLDKGATAFRTKYMEEFQRSLAVHVMKEITDVAVSSGKLEQRVANTYINTFVNRCQGNYLASQRPGMFHGPVGQAAGLFQTYNINLLQQLFRHVGEGSKKSAALMMGMQAGIFGASGLPGFQAINTHLVGNAAGNSNHNDIYKSAYANTDKDVADFVMYGGLSNIGGIFHPDFKMNLYTRGDINPRHLLIIPTAFEDLPIVSVASRFFGNILDTGSKILSGADVGTTLARGIEHNSINRPLAGLGVALESLTNSQHLAYSTSNGGNLVSAHDIMSYATVTRLLGGKLLDDAKTSDEAARETVYRATNAERVAALGEVLKTRIVGNEPLTQEETAEFQHKYVKAGGKQEGFNRYMTATYAAANTAQANIIANKLKSHESQVMQNLMGGRFRDFNSGPSDAESANEDMTEDMTESSEE